MAIRLNDRAKALPVLLGTVAFGLSAVAQDGGPQGTVQTFGIGERLQYSDNLELAPVSPGATSEAITYLSFGLSKNTDTSSLQLDASLQLLFADAPPGSTATNGLQNPFLGLTYQTNSASSTFGLDLSLQQTNLSQIRPVTDFDTGSGQRGNALVAASIDWGQDAPFGFGLSAAYEDITYSDTTDTSLNDAQRFDLGADASLALSPTTSLTLGLSRSNFQEQDASSGQLTIGADAGLVIQRANGDQASANIFIDNTETGQREGISAQYQMALPNGSLQFTPGLTRATTGEVYWTSDFVWQQDLPTGSFSLGWNQQVTQQNENNEEVVLSDVGLSYNQAVDPLNSFEINLDWAQQVYTASNDTSTNASFGAVWSRSLTPDWNLDFGYTYRISDGRTDDSAESNTIYLQLNRDFRTQF